MQGMKLGTSGCQTLDFRMKPPNLCAYSPHPGSSPYARVFVYNRLYESMAQARNTNSSPRESEEAPLKYPERPGAMQEPTWNVQNLMVNRSSYKDKQPLEDSVLARRFSYPILSWHSTCAYLILPHLIFTSLLFSYLLSSHPVASVFLFSYLLFSHLILSDLARSSLTFIPSLTFADFSHLIFSPPPISLSHLLFPFPHLSPLVSSYPLSPCPLAPHLRTFSHLR